MEAQRKYMTGDEKTNLTELVKKHILVLDPKKNDAVNMTKKKKAWAELTNEFNGYAEHTPRATQQLQKAWNNIKGRRRKELSQEKTDRMATGDGVYNPPTTHDPVDEMLDAHVDIELKYTTDCDSLEIFQNVEEEYRVEREDGNEVLAEFLVADDADVTGNSNEPAISTPLLKQDSAQKKARSSGEGCSSSGSKFLRKKKFYQTSRGTALDEN